MPLKVADGVMERVVTVPSADVVEYKVEGLAKNLTGCNARRLAKVCTLEGYTAYETEWAMEGLYSRVSYDRFYC